MPDLDHEPRDSRVQLHVLVRVDVVERQAGGAERRELCPDFRGKLVPNTRREEIPECRVQLIVVEMPVRAHQAAQLRGRQRRASIDQHQMQPDAQPPQAARPLDGIGRRRRRHHQAGAGKDAVAVGPFDRFVDRDIEAEIVGTEDQALRRTLRQPPQLGISRWRRNWKNSTPSRNRRRIISGLRIISPSSEAIFRRRK